MRQFKNIFYFNSTWELNENEKTHFIDGIQGLGNIVFKDIIESINKYLGNNSGSVIEFGLLKDAVDRHCDSIENDITTQTPIPLYWGLAGTMAGVILGLWDLLDSNAILTLMGSSGGVINVASQNAAEGVNSLLSGVAWAMSASICGILFTTINSILFKKCKLQEEKGKNSFLAWMQSELLPELPSDTSEALNKLVKNLNKFNSTFANNTKDLGSALQLVNDSYKTQADVIQAVHDMDITKMAKANINVLKNLQSCTEELEQFNEYLQSINGYTEAIHRFEEQFQQQADDLNILREIRDFFIRNKEEIAIDTTEARFAVDEALRLMKESTSKEIEAFNDYVSEQYSAQKDFFQKQTNMFEQQLNRYPQIIKQLEDISKIPDHLDKLIMKIESSNAKLSSNVTVALNQINRNDNPTSKRGGNEFIPHEDSKLQKWMKFTGWIAILIIAITCIFDIIKNLI